MIIAVDGTLASGKGTLARKLAAHYGLPHMDTGALYRRVGVAALSSGTALEDEAALARLAGGLDAAEPVDEAALRTPEAGQAASRVAALPAVRRALLDAQRRFARQPGGAVLDGRDIGTVVVPEADAKLWVDADPEERARRRHLEHQGRGEAVTYEEVLDALRQRDRRDAERTDAPMRRAGDAVLIDTTRLGIGGAFDGARAAIEAARAACRGG